MDNIKLKDYIKQFGNKNKSKEILKEILLQHPNCEVLVESINYGCLTPPPPHISIADLDVIQEQEVQDYSVVIVPYNNSPETYIDIFPGRVENASRIFEGLIVGYID